jgi:putative hydrolase of the HAD superfamily
MIRAVLVDLGGVLLHRRLRPTAARWDEALGLEPGGFLDALYRGTDATVLVGKVGADEHWAAVARGLGLSAARARQARDELDGASRLDAQLARFVGGLRPGCGTAVVANVWSDGREECRRHGIEALVDEVVLSAEVGFAKPDPAIYRIALERLGAVPDEAVLVDDAEENVAAARAIGLHAVLYENRRDAIAAIEALLADSDPARG